MTYTVYSTGMITFRNQNVWDSAKADYTSWDQAERALNAALDEHDVAMLVMDGFAHETRIKSGLATTYMAKCVTRLQCSIMCDKIVAANVAA